MDDFILFVPANGINETLHVFSSFNPHLFFTVEIETNYSVPFLDTRVIRTSSDTIIVDWYQKATALGRYINFLPRQDQKIKLSLISALKNRC